VAGVESVSRFLAWKSIWRQRRLFGYWALSLSVAVSGLIIVDVFRASLTELLVRQGRSLLSADFAVSVRRPFTPDEEGAVLMLVGPRFSRATEMFAMVTRVQGAAASRLGDVRFIDDAYPMAGELMIDFGAGAGPARGSMFGAEPEAWVAPDWLILLELKPGDAIQIGDVRFKIAGQIRKDPSQTVRIGSMAPRIYVHRRFLEASKLVKFGSSFSETIYMNGSEKDLKKRLEAALKDPAVQVTTPEDLEQGSFRVLSRLLDFLGLTGLVTLCLGWVGVYYLGRRWLILESRNVGLLKCLGLKRAELRRGLITKMTVILCAGIGFGAGFAWLAAKSLLPAFKDSLPADFALVWSWPTTLLLFLIGPVVGYLLLWPAMRALSSSPAMALMHGHSDGRERWREAGAFIITLGGVFFLLTLAQAHSWRVTFIFLGALTGSIALVLAAGFGLLRVLSSRQGRGGGWLWHLSLSHWVRRPGLTLLLICVSALAGLLSQLVPNLERTLVGQLQNPPGADRPSLFLFDIQDDQMKPFEDFLAGEHLAISESAPFIRARILTVNGKEFERTHTGPWTTREQEVDARFRNRGVNLTYRRELSPSEKIIAGKTWPEMNKQGTVDISVEEGYADRLNIVLGDLLRFDVQGVEFDGRVASLRDVDWNSFEPNFFIQFPDGVLNEAPKTWIMTLKRDPSRAPARIQALIAPRFPNITSLNVQETLDTVADLFGKLSAGLKLASDLCLALGIFVFLMIFLFQIASSRQDWLQLSILGLRRRELLWVQALTYGGISLAGVIVGSLLSVAVAAAIARFAFTIRLQIDAVKMGEVLTLALSVLGAGLAFIGGIQNRDVSLTELEAD
jgi:putative ABC transport system permease protein